MVGRRSLDLPRDAACAAATRPVRFELSADFKEKARRQLLGIYNHATEAGDEELRGALLKFIGGASPDEAPALSPGTTTLDRVHIAMLLQAAGKSNALRTMLKAESERGQDFLRLANALSALYPRDSEEKRLVDAMLLAMPK